LKWFAERRWDAVNRRRDNMATTATINENVRNYWMATAMATAVMPVVAEEVALEEEEDLLAQTLAERWGEMGDSYWEAKTAEWDNHKFGLCFRCNCGLDDRADFVNCNYDTYTRLFCNDCFSRMV
jgi:hypothetical protein